MNDGAAAVTNDEKKAIHVPHEVAHKIGLNIPKPNVRMQPFAFHFKKDKELGEKRPTVNLAIPLITLDGLIEALSDPKQQEYILDVLADQAYVAARAQISDEEHPVNKQEELNLEKLTIKYLANMPKAERTGGGISKEIWEDFGKDYLAVMPGVTNKTPEQVGNAATLFLKKFQPVKTNKKVLAHLKQQLALYAGHTENLEDFKECVEFLDNKVDSLLTADEAQLLANL